MYIFDSTELTCDWFTRDHRTCNVNNMEFKNNKRGNFRTIKCVHSDRETLKTYI